MKRYLVLLMAILLLFVQVNAVAESSGIVESVTVKPGDEVTVYFSGISLGAYNFTVNFTYDKTVLEFVSAKAETIAGATLTAPESGEPNVDGVEPSFSYMSTTTPFTFGKIGSITFKVRPEAAPGSYKVEALVEFASDSKDNDVELGVDTDPLIIVEKGESGCTSHIWDDGEVTTPASCKAEGVKTFTCTNHGCGATKTEPIPMLTTHTPAAAVREKEVAATCKDAGSYDEVVYCSVCKTEISRTTKTIDKLTTHTDANQDYLCDVCGAELPKPVMHKVTVTGGTGNGEYAVGATVSVQATAESGKTFVKWNGLEGLTLTLGTAQSTGISFVMPDRDVALTAEYQAVAPATYTVTFLPNGGTGEMKAESGVSGLYTLPECGFAAPAGKLFKGWALEEKGEVLNTPYLIGADVTLYAIWVDAPMPKFTSPTQAQLVEVYEKETGTMTVSATNTDKYQWYINRNDGRGYVAIKGAVNSTYTTSATNLKNDGYTYYCVASNAYGTAQSVTFTLKVKAVLPATGDGAPLAAWCALLMVSAAGVVMMRRRHA